MNWKLSPAGLRRIAQLLTESVARGATRDVGLRDQALEQVRQLGDDRAARLQRRQTAAAGAGAQTIFRRARQGGAA